MKYLKKYKLFESVNEQEIHDLCRKYGIENYTINSDRSIDVDGGVDLNDHDLTKLPLRFNQVMGNFYCINNSLINLINSPKEVIGNFSFGNNNVSGFKGVPDIIKGNLGCYNNLITNLDGLVFKKFDRIYIQSNPIALVIGFPIYDVENRSYDINKIPDIHDLINKHWINSTNRDELIEYFVDMNIIQDTEKDKPKLIIPRLEAFYEEMELEMDINLEEVKKYYKIIE